MAAAPERHRSRSRSGSKDAKGACQDSAAPALGQHTRLNQAFVFIKPHAVTDKVKELAKKTLEDKGLKITSEGSLDGKTIDAKQLIDNHYYAIANKASLSKPAELNPPAARQADFEKKFGVSWKAALEQGLVYNAVDGCALLGIDGATMDKKWAAAKKEGSLLKFGGGFYAGKIAAPAHEPSVGWFSALALSLAAMFGR